VKKLVLPLGLVVAGVLAAQFLVPQREGVGAPGAHPPDAGAAATDGAAPAAQKAAPTGPMRRITYVLSNILVNLANSGSKRYLKISLALDCEVPEKGSEDEMRVRIDSLKSQFNDRVIEMLSARTVESLEGRDSKVALKSDIQKELDPILAAATGGRVAKLSYQEFVIQ
jgi:flagellar basal body-associated protein FliL